MGAESQAPWCCTMGLPMRLFAQDSFYCYYRCDACGREQMTLKDDYPGKIEDARADDPQL